MNAHGTRGQTALMWAVAQKHPDVVKVLLAHGANVNARSDVWTELWRRRPNRSSSELSGEAPAWAAIRR